MRTGRRYTYAEYQRLLERSDLKLEYCDGVIDAMAGGTVAHGQLGAAAAGVLREKLLGRCRVFSSDVMIRIEASDLSTYPDGSVVCGDLERSPLDANAIVNPSILVEVTSRSTEDYDRGDKLSHYKQVPSVRAVLFISHRTETVTVIERSTTGWAEREVRSGETVSLAEPNGSFAIDVRYAGVELEP